ELERAEAVRLERVAHELILALRFVHTEPAAGDDMLAVLRPELQQPGRRAEHHRTQLRVVVFQREVDMPRAPLPAVRDFALHREDAEAAFHERLEARGDFTDRQRGASRRTSVFKGQHEIKYYSFHAKTQRREADGQQVLSDAFPT